MQTLPPDTQFRAVSIEKTADGGSTFSVINRSVSELPAGDLLVRVRYSSLNYKDALSATGHRGVTRSYPHTPGIDAAGEVVRSDSPDFLPGQQVIVTGHDLGQNTPGGWGEFISVPSGWAVPLPAGLNLRESMALGTAGFTAAQCVERIVEHGVTPADGDILVTGASGGVGSITVAILAQLGYNVVAVSGKQDRHDWLRHLGASRVAGRSEVTDTSGKPLLERKWAAAVDNVGGRILATVLRQIAHRGLVAAVGNAGGVELEMTVYPFILRGITLAGIDSSACPPALRLAFWNKLSGQWKPRHLGQITREVTLEEMESEINAILQGQVAGRVVVHHAG
jgi:acrylyl-CoA reductase (NADPH)